MRYLLDTNVLSELTNERPDPGVMGWFDQHSPADLCTSVIIIGELRLGIERLINGRRRVELDIWFQNALPVLVQGGILSVDRAVAELYGRVRADQLRSGRTRGELDTWIIATALVHALPVVTRNVRDFGGQGVELIDPWNLDGSKEMAGTDRW